MTLGRDRNRERGEGRKETDQRQSEKETVMGMKRVADMEKGSQLLGVCFFVHSLIHSFIHCSKDIY